MRMSVSLVRYGESIERGIDLDLCLHMRQTIQTGNHGLIPQWKTEL